jgi:uncharacterized protein (TIGR03066 family)
MKSKEKRRLREQAAQGRANVSPPASKTKSEWKRRLALVVVMLLAAGSAWAFFEFVIWNELPSEVVGKWEIADGPHTGDTFEFYRNGSMVGTIYPNGKEGKINARVKLDGKKLFFTSNSQETGQVTTQVQAIRTLTSRQMVMEDEQGQVLKMERVDK